MRDPLQTRRGVSDGSPVAVIGRLSTRRARLRSSENSRLEKLLVGFYGRKQHNSRANSSGLLPRGVTVGRSLDAPQFAVAVVAGVSVDDGWLILQSRLWASRLPGTGRRRGRAVGPAAVGDDDDRDDVKKFGDDAEAFGHRPVE
jgi:hypothetical protein